MAQNVDKIREPDIIISTFQLRSCRSLSECTVCSNFSVFSLNFSSSVSNFHLRRKKQEARLLRIVAKLIIHACFSRLRRQQCRRKCWLFFLFVVCHAVHSHITWHIFCVTIPLWELRMDYRTDLT